MFLFLRRDDRDDNDGVRRRRPGHGQRRAPLQHREAVTGQPVLQHVLHRRRARRHRHRHPCYAAGQRGGSSWRRVLKSRASFYRHPSPRRWRWLPRHRLGSPLPPKAYELLSDTLARALIEAVHSSLAGDAGAVVRQGSLKNRPAGTAGTDAVKRPDQPSV